MSKAVEGIGSLFSSKTPDTGDAERLADQQEEEAKRREAAERRKVKAAATAATGGSRWGLVFQKTGETGVPSAPSAPAAPPVAGKKTLG